MKVNPTTDAEARRHPKGGSNLAEPTGPFTIKQTAAALALSPYTVRAWIAARRLGVHRLGRAIRVPRSEVDRVLEHGFVPARRDVSR